MVYFQRADGHGEALYRSPARQTAAELNVVLQENVPAIKLVKAYNREPYEAARFNEVNWDVREGRMKTTLAMAMAGTGQEFATSLSGRDHHRLRGLAGDGRGQLTVGSLTAFYSLRPGHVGPRALDDLREPDGAAGDGRGGAGVRDPGHPPGRGREAGRRRPAPPGGAARAASDVSFAYGQGAPLLREITATVEPGQTLALVGPSGSGKTTLINLIPRFYDVTAGAVRVDGHDVRDVTLASLRAQVGMVMQETFLFNAHHPGQHLLRAPGGHPGGGRGGGPGGAAHDFITEFPEGYETLIGERGVRLSGGQRQRLAIARAILVDPRILILDEATSSVDTRTDYLIQQALDGLMRGRTTVVIAHRLSTVQRAHQILVLEGGRVTARGTHAELLRTSPLYRHLYEIQFELQREGTPSGAAARRRRPARLRRPPGRGRTAGASRRGSGDRRLRPGRDGLRRAASAASAGRAGAAGGIRLSMQEKRPAQDQPLGRPARAWAGLVAPYRLPLGLATACVLITSALQLTMPWAFKHVIDVTIPAGDRQQLLLIGAGLVRGPGAAPGPQLLRALPGGPGRRQQVVYRLATDLFEHIQRLSLRFFERWGTGEIISRITNDISVLQQAVNGGTVRAAIGIVQHGGLRRRDGPPRLALALLVLPHRAPAVRRRRRHGRQAARALPARPGADGRGEQRPAGEHLRGARRQGLRPGRRAAAALPRREPGQPERQPLHRRGAGRGHPGGPDDLRLRDGAGAGRRDLADGATGQITVGTLVAFVSYLVQFYQPVEDLIRVNNTVQQALAASERIFEFLDEAPDVVDRPGPATCRRCEGRGAPFEGVTFAYEPGKPVLHEVSLRRPRRGRSWPWWATPARARPPW